MIPNKKLQRRRAFPLKKPKMPLSKGGLSQFFQGDFEIGGDKERGEVLTHKNGGVVAQVVAEFSCGTDPFKYLLLADDGDEVRSFVSDMDVARILKVGDIIRVCNARIVQSLGYAMELVTVESVCPSSVTVASRKLINPAALPNVFVKAEEQSGESPAKLAKPAKNTRPTRRAAAAVETAHDSTAAAPAGETAHKKRVRLYTPSEEAFMLAIKDQVQPPRQHLTEAEKAKATKRKQENIRKRQAVVAQARENKQKRKYNKKKKKMEKQPNLLLQTFNYNFLKYTANSFMIKEWLEAENEKKPLPEAIVRHMEELKYNMKAAPWVEIADEIAKTRYPNMIPNSEVDNA